MGLRMKFVSVTYLISVCLLALSTNVVAQDQTRLEANQFRFEHQLRVNPFDPAALNNLAVVKAAQGRYGDARDLLERAARLAPLSEEVRSNLGRLTAWEASLGGVSKPDLAEIPPSRLPPEPPALWQP